MSMDQPHCILTDLNSFVTHQFAQKLGIRQFLMCCYFFKDSLAWIVTQAKLWFPKEQRWEKILSYQTSHNSLLQINMLKQFDLVQILINIRRKIVCYFIFMKLSCNLIFLLQLTSFWGLMPQKCNGSRRIVFCCPCFRVGVFSNVVELNIVSFSLKENWIFSKNEFLKDWYWPFWCLFQLHRFD